MVRLEVKKLVRRMYKKSLGSLLETFGIQAVENFPALRDVDAVGPGLALGVATDFEDIEFGRCLVVGGPCIDHCGGDLGQVTIQLLVDIVNPLVVAKRLRRPCLIYLATLEEALTRAERTTETEERWKVVTATLRQFIRQLARFLEVPDVIVLETGEPRVQAVTAGYVEQYRADLRSDRLRGLYSVGSSRPRTDVSAERYEAYRYTVVAYLPSVLRELTPFDFTNVLVAENLQEIRAVETARWLNQRAFDRATGSSMLEQLVIVPSPSVSGTARMYRAPRRSVINLLEDDEVIVEKLTRASAPSAYYWYHIWPREFRQSITAGDPQKETVSVLAIAREMFKVSIWEATMERGDAR